MRFDRPPPEPLASAPGFLLSWNGQRTAHTFAEALKPLGLKPPHFGVLTLIDSDPGTTQQELVDRSMIDPSSMVAVIDELEELGLAERQTHPSDRRKHAVHLTDQGRKTLQRARASAIETAKELFAPLSAAETETLRLLLRKLAGVAEVPAGSGRSPSPPPPDAERRRRRQ
ncbi:MAG: MarR family winged helix-turn-helix transcriptional regulator [Solirubrobacterales bacterium]